MTVISTAPLDLQGSNEKTPFHLNLSNDAHTHNAKPMHTIFHHILMYMPWPDTARIAKNVQKKKKSSV